MNINFNAHILDLKGKEIEGGPIVAADQIATLVLSDKGASVETAREADKLNALVERIACAEEPVDLSTDEIKLLHKVLDNAVKAHNVSTFLVGRLYGILEKDPEEG